MLPVLQKLSEDPYGIFCLVLTPTRSVRCSNKFIGKFALSFFFLLFSLDDKINVMSCRELAYQIAEQFRVLGKPLGLRDCIVVGGMGENILFFTIYDLH